MDNSIANSAPKKTKWFHTVWGVLFLLAALGPFALPCLWKSETFSIFWKWVITISMIFLTIILAWSTWVVIQTTVREFRSAGLMPW